MESKLVLPTAILATLATPSCFQGESAAFDSSDLAEGSLPSAVSTHEPVIVKLLDDNLLCVTQNKYDVKFYKTAEGYAESGLDGSVDIKLVKLGGSVDYTEANLYYEITPLEALALVDYDWRMIYEPVAKQADSDSRSVEPQLAGRLLEWLASGSSVNTAPELSDDLPNWYAARAMEVIGLKYVQSTTEAFGLDLKQVTPSSERIPVFVRMPNNSLLRVSQENLEESDTGRVRFYKTSSGYGVKGIRGNLIFVGGGFEEPVGGVYTEISPKEVRAYFDGDVSKVLERTAIQSEFMNLSVNPELVRMILAPQSTAPKDSQVKVSAHTKAPEPVKDQPPQVAVQDEFKYFEDYFKELERNGKVEYPDDWAEYDLAARNRFKRAMVMANIPAVPISKKAQ